MNLVSKIAILLIAVLIIAGYFLSDDIYYSGVIKKNGLTSSQSVFNWVTTHYGNHAGVVHTNVTPSHLMQKHKNLYCDEGAMVMAILDHKLGYKTRLIDIIGPDSIAHHTVLQVNEYGQWVNEDFTCRTYNSPLSESASKFKVMLAGKRIRPFPQFYNIAVSKNYFLKQLAVKLRGIDESGE